MRRMEELQCVGVTLCIYSKGDRLKIRMKRGHLNWGESFLKKCEGDDFVALKHSNTLGDLEDQIQKKLGIAPRNQKWQSLFRHPSGVVFDVSLPNSTYSYRRSPRDSNDTPLDEAFHSQLINTKIYSEKPRDLAGQYSVWSCVCTDGACDICDL